jgi:hypothetical protein
MKKDTVLLRMTVFLIVVAGFGACKKDPYEGITSNERSIEAFQLAKGQMGPAEIDRAAGKVRIYAVTQGLDLTQVAPQIQTSYKSKVSPASGEPANFAANNNTFKYTLTAESGQTREWTVEIVPFIETLEGKYRIQSLAVYGGTGPEYGGASILKMIDKPWAWPAADGPAAEMDNELTFALTGVTEDGNTFGTVINDAGADGLYADFTFVLNPRTDVNHFYRTIPKGQGTWLRNYANNTVTFTFADGSTTTGTFNGPGSEDLGNGQSKTLTDQAFAFTLNGTDDWGNIYSDYDKFVKKPRKYWIEVKKE